VRLKITPYFVNKRHIPLTVLQLESVTPEELRDQALAVWHAFHQGEWKMMISPSLQSKLQTQTTPVESLLCFEEQEMIRTVLGQ